MTRTRYGVSPWIEELPAKRRPDFPRLRGPATYPVVIIGGGLAGCMTAYAFAAAGIKVALLEAERVGAGGTSRGPGILQGEAAASFREVETRLGRKAARGVFEASRRAVLDLATAARRLGAADLVEVHDAIRIASPYGGGEKALKKDVEARRDAGLEAVWLKSIAARRHAGVDNADAGARLHDWGRADPYRVLTTFVRAAVERGASVFERSAARRIKVRRKTVDIYADGGTLTAETVVICTGEPTDLYRSLKRHFESEERYSVMTDRLPAAIRKQARAQAPVVTDTEVPSHMVRWTDDHRVIIAGGDQPRTADRGKDRVLVQRTGQLMYELSRLYPAISGVMPAYGWDLPIATTADRVMYAGPHRNYPRHLFAWATRHDPSQAFLASRILLRHYLGESDRDDSWFAFTRG